MTSHPQTRAENSFLVRIFSPPSLLFSPPFFILRYRSVSLSRAVSLSLFIPYFISVPSRPPLLLRLYHRGSPVVGSADFFLGYRPVDRAAIRWTAIRIDYSLPKLRRGAFILYNSPEALVPSSLSLSSLASSSLAITARRRSSRARRHPMRSLARASAKRPLRGSTHKHIHVHI